MLIRSSLTDWMKQAEHCGFSYAFATSSTVPALSSSVSSGLQAKLPPVPLMP